MSSVLTIIGFCVTRVGRRLFSPSAVISEDMLSLHMSFSFGLAPCMAHEKPASVGDWWAHSVEGSGDAAQSGARAQVHVPVFECACLQCMHTYQVHLCSTTIDKHSGVVSFLLRAITATYVFSHFSFVVHRVNIWQFTSCPPMLNAMAAALSVTDAAGADISVHGSGVSGRPSHRWSRTTPRIVSQEAVRAPSSSRQSSRRMRCNVVSTLWS